MRRINKTSKHQQDEYGENVYRVRWYGYKTSKETWEPIARITRSNITSYYNRKNINLPTDLDQAIDG